MTFCPRAHIRYNGGAWIWRIGNRGLDGAPSFAGLTYDLPSAFRHATMQQQAIMTATLCEEARHPETGEIWAH